MDSGIHWMEVTVLPGPGCQPNVVIKAVSAAIKAGAQQGGGQAKYVFRVVGENRVIAALLGGVLGAQEAVNEAAGEHVSLTTHPCRQYEQFVERIVRLDPEIARKAAATNGVLEGKGRLLLFHVEIDYRSLSQQQLLDAYKREAEHAFPLRISGQLNADLYKFVGKMEVAAIMRTEDIEDMDDAFWKLPLYVDHGSIIRRHDVKSLDFC